MHKPKKGKQIMKNKYPAKLFWMGVLINILRQFVLVIAALVLMVIGIWHPACSLISLGILVLVFIVAIVGQLRYRHTLLHSNDPEMESLRQTVLDENWQGNIMTMLGNVIKGSSEDRERYLDMSHDELEALSDDELFSAVDARVEEQVERYEDLADGLNALNASQKVFYTLNWLEIEVNNGGLCQFFVNSSRIVAPWVSTSMNIIGAIEHQRLYDNFVQENGINLNDLSFFDVQKVSEFQEKTKRYPFDQYDHAFYQMESLESYLKRYIRENLTDF